MTKFSGALFVLSGTPFDSSEDLAIDVFPVNPGC